MEVNDCCQVEGAALAAANYAPGKKGWVGGCEEGPENIFSFGLPPPRGASEVFLTSRSSSRQVVCQGSATAAAPTGRLPGLHIRKEPTFCSVCNLFVYNEVRI